MWWKKHSTVTPFVAPGDDGLTAEHRVVSAWVEEAHRSLGERNWYADAELKSQPSGRHLLEAEPDQARRYVHAAVVQAAHWDRLTAEFRARGKSDLERANPHLKDGWQDLWARRRNAGTVVSALMRRALPFDEHELLAIIDWCTRSDPYSMSSVPVGHVTRALQRYVATHPLADRLRASISQLASRLRQSHGKDDRRHGTALEQLSAGSAAGGASAAPNDEAPVAPSPPPDPAPAGNPAVHDAVKRRLGIGGGEVPARVTGPDAFPLREDSPYRREHALLDELLAAVVGTRNYAEPRFESLAMGDTILRMDPAPTGRLLVAAAERDAAGSLARTELENPAGWQSRYAVGAVTKALVRRPFTLDRNGLFDFLLYIAVRAAPWDRAAFEGAFGALLGQAEQEAATSPLTGGERFVLHLLRTSWISGPPLGAPANEIARLSALVGDNATFFLVPGEAWTDQLNDDLARLERRERNAWIGLLTHTLSATAARPSQRWIKTAERLIGALGADQVSAALRRWLPRVPEGRTVGRLSAFPGDVRSAADVMHEENATCLRGLLWLTPTLTKDDELTRAIAATAQSAYRKVPGVGPRAVKVGNAAVYALSESPSPDAVGHLAMLKVRVKFATAQKEIEKAFTAAAEALGLPRDQIEEMAVPSYGLEDVGLRRETFAAGEFTAELRVNGRDVTLQWLRADGKPQKAVPAKIKSEHKEELKELQGAVKDIAAMLPAQSERLDSMFLQQKTWPVAVWRERYLEHPLVGTLARQLIWTVSRNGRSRAGIWRGDTLVDSADETIECAPDAQVALWHPIGQPLGDVLAWRRWIEAHEIRQPFKQAHREVYLLTDAERGTQTYSNRFAAHVLRQHQYNALCAARGWKNKLRMLVDDVYPPTLRELPPWGLRAEYWIEGAGGDYGTDTNESGAFRWVVTDQVRFYRSGAATNRAHAGGGGYESQAIGPGERRINEPLRLEEIPPLVFSEIMRDVDLFVGVASVGNDPTWQDGGPGGRYRAYWNSYSFGELGETAKTRRAILEQLIPKLKIGRQCTLTDRFLVVRGSLRTYKIHLGSGNVLMEPTDEYLCIVPARGVAAGNLDRIFLPFEGDATLSIVLSKAFLLAADESIKDTTIVRQIKRH